MNGAINGTAKNGAAKNGAANGATMNGVVLFDAYDARTEIKLLQAQFKTEQEQKCAKDLQKFLLQKEDNSWLLDDQLHSLISRTLGKLTDMYFYFFWAVGEILKICTILLKYRSYSRVFFIFS